MKYSELVEVYEQLDGTTKRLHYTHIISEFLKTINEGDLSSVVLLLEGRIFSRQDDSEIGIASKILVKAISIASGIQKEKINEDWKGSGDLGTTAYNLIKKKKQVTLASQDLTIEKVLKNLRELAIMEGSGSVDRKISLIAELLTSATPAEAKYIARTILDDMRIGVGEGTIRDSIVWAFFGEKLKVQYVKEEHKVEIEDRELYNKYVGAVQGAYDVTNDFVPVAKAAKKGLEALQKVEMEIGNPIKVMLALKAKNIEEAFERCGKPAEFEYKYDGMRMQIHKDGGKVKIFTRRLENITQQFPEVVEYVKSHIREDKVILDSEAVGYDKKAGRYLPFQNISQRIKRKHGIEDLSKKFPVEVNVFDVINYRGKTTTKLPFKDRKEILKKIIDEKEKKIVLAKSITTSDEQAVSDFYRAALDSGNEGLMAKKLDAPYKPGGRVGYMVKLKPTKENLDLMIVAAEWGDGKRSEWITSYTLACIDENNNLLEVGKASTGLKEKNEEGLSFDDLTKLLKPLVTKESGKGLLVKPKIVLEIGYEELQKSPTYTSGYALRFPRVIKLREDLGKNDIATLEMIESAYGEQKK
ncbi:ATP-dependent DNA ligase [Candidatus Woesearchaeota archaeon]|nr:ATP-dependent DNA ligase [Candidatus Woesearchaeota archaeon]